MRARIAACILLLATLVGGLAWWGGPGGRRALRPEAPALTGRGAHADEPPAVASAPGSAGERRAAEGPERARIETAGEQPPGPDPDAATTPRGVGPLAGGRVVDDRGEPLEDWMVGAVRPDRLGGHLCSDRTDGEGRFLLEDLPDGPCWIEVREPDLWTGDPALVLEEFEAGARDLLLVVTDGQRATAFIEGRLVDGGGAFVTGSSLTVWSRETERAYPASIDAGTGDFRGGPFRPGSYAVGAYAPGHGRGSLHEVELRSGQVVDLGTIRLLPPGSLLLTVAHRDDDQVDGTMFAWVLSRSGEFLDSIELQNGQGRSAAMQPGEYRLRLAGPKIRTVEQPLFIQSGSETLVELRVERGIGRTLSLKVAEGDSALDRVHVTVRDASGFVLMDQEASPTGQGEFLVYVSGLTPGRFEVEARADDGRAGRAIIDVEGFEAGERIVLELR